MKTLQFVTVAVFLHMALLCGWVGRTQAAPPNIILILCDDMGWSDLGCYGGEIETPNLDQLAAEGVRFTQFYNNAKCTTTRASLVSGLYARPKPELLQTNMVTLGEVLGDHGYQTALSGKWHLGREATTHPVHRGFSEFYGLLDGCCNFFDPSIVDPPYKSGRIRYFAHNLSRVTQFPDDFYTTDAFTDHAMSMMRRFASADRPFFLHLCYTAPHYPLHAKPQDIAKYRGKYVRGWDELREERFVRQQELGIAEDHWRLSGDDVRAYGWESANHDFEDHRMAVYAAMVDAMDQNIGRLLACVEELGLGDNTVVMFMSDNGGCAEEPGGRDPTIREPGPKHDYVAVGPSWGWAQNAPFRRYKSWAHEGGICTPCIVRWPGVVEANTVSRQPAHIIDVLPTFLEIAGGDYPVERAGNEILPTEGLSMVPILRGHDRSPHSQLFWEWKGNAAIREGDWKLVWDTLEKRWSLYNLAEDRTEMFDLSASRPDLVAHMSTAYDEWAVRTGNKRIR